MTGPGRTPDDLPARPGYTGPDPWLADAGRLLGEAGGFWAEVHLDRPLLQALLRGPARLTEGYDLQARQAAALESRADCPPLWESLWERLDLAAAGRGAGGRPGVSRPGPGVGGERLVGVGGGGLAWYPLPAGWADLPAVCDRLADPGRVWVHGIDFVVEDGAVGFAADPVPAGAAGVRLWAYRSRRDRGDLWARWGFPLGHRPPPTALGRAALAAAWDAVVRGPTEAAVRRLLAACCGCPWVEPGRGGVVEAVHRWPDRTWVVTADAAYPCGPAGVPLAAAGLPAEGFLTDAVRAVRVGRGRPLPGWLAGLSVGAGFLPEGVGPVFFPNADRPVAVDGRGCPRLGVAGDPAGVDRLWAGLDPAAVRGLLLAATGAEVPAAANPAAVLAASAWDGCLLAVVRPEAVPADAPGLAALAALLPWAVPARRAVLVAAAGAVGDTVGPGLLAAAATAGRAATAAETVTPGSSVQASVVVRLEGLV